MRLVNDAMKIVHLCHYRVLLLQQYYVSLCNIIMNDKGRYHS